METRRLTASAMETALFQIKTFTDTKLIIPKDSVNSVEKSYS
jgi:hypothetical protein